jgi:fatty acid-binding protein DegV
MAQRVRPRSTVDLVEPLGAVVGTHAGPGAVGFFWFQD